MSNVHHLPAGEREAVLRALSRVCAKRAEIVFGYVHGSFLGQDRFRDIDVPVSTDPDANRRTDIDLAGEFSTLGRLPNQIDSDIVPP